MEFYRSYFIETKYREGDASFRLYIPLLAIIRRSNRRDVDL